AIKMGMVPAGGLFVPEEIPSISIQQLEQWKDLSYSELATNIFSFFLENDFSENEISSITRNAYNSENFDSNEITPLKQLDDQLYIMELFHGPTGAFKDIALQALPHILSGALEKLSITNQLIILVATSGDTGKAALEGFKDVPGTRIIVYYPFQMVSKIQELQMLTTEGNNTHVVSVRGNFDDCQNAVKDIFTDKQFSDYLLEEGYEFSSANSINWGRLFPQIVYYFYAYLSLLKKKKIQLAEKINFTVPTGNFGNILAAWYARKMGLPVEKLICASNINKVLTDFFQNGIYDRNRHLISTISPSMDILISSNLERFLFEISDHNEVAINYWMRNLQEKGNFKLEKTLKNKMEEIVFAGYASEKETMNTIKKVYNQYQYLIDPHTAVGVKVFNDYKVLVQDNTKTVVDATASPFKFNQSVFTALSGENNVKNMDELVLLQELSKYSGSPIPANLQELTTKKIRHNLVYDKKDIRKSLQDILKI
ncbi:MAG: threonine synthase, partial [Atribacterota bacterium]|nr:threonine synthase [Atribacterota bacterium]MDD4288922.1 threonine synthase [Atribacterota bacterium]